LFGNCLAFLGNCLGLVLELFRNCLGIVLELFGNCFAMVDMTVWSSRLYGCLEFSIACLSEVLDCIA
jgi:hypothetical protein